MKKKIIKFTFDVLTVIQFFVAFCYFFETILHFNFDNLCIFVSAALGFYFSIEYGKEFIDKWE